MYRLLGILIGIVVSALLLQQLMILTAVKEGFVTADVESEDRMTPEAFSYNLIQAVKGPIRRLGSQLMNIETWKNRLELARLTPVELARRQYTNPSV